MTWLSPDAASSGSFCDQALVQVGVRRRIALDQILRVADDLRLSLGRCRQREREIHVDRHRAPHVDIALERLEALRADLRW